MAVSFWKKYPSYAQYLIKLTTISNHFVIRVLISGQMCDIIEDFNACKLVIEQTSLPEDKKLLILVSTGCLYGISRQTTTFLVT